MHLLLLFFQCPVEPDANSLLDTVGSGFQRPTNPPGEQPPGSKKWFGGLAGLVFIPVLFLDSAEKRQSCARWSQEQGPDAVWC